MFIKHNTLLASWLTNVCTAMQYTKTARGKFYKDA